MSPHNSFPLNYFAQIFCHKNSGIHWYHWAAAAACRRYRNRNILRFLIVPFWGNVWALRGSFYCRNTPVVIPRILALYIGRVFCVHDPFAKKKSLNWVHHSKPSFSFMMIRTISNDIKKKFCLEFSTFWALNRAKSREKKFSGHISVIKTRRIESNFVLSYKKHIFII